MSFAVADEDRSLAKSSRDGAGRPGFPGDLADLFESDDLQDGVPGLAFLGAEPGLDLLQRPVLVAQRHLAVIARAGHPEIQFERVRGPCRTCPSACHGGDRKCHNGLRDGWKDAPTHRLLLSSLVPRRCRAGPSGSSEDCGMSPVQKAPLTANPRPQSGRWPAP